jgi:hypothetical protein
MVQLDRHPGAGADLGPQLCPGQARQHPRAAGRGPPDRLPEPDGVQFAPPGQPGRPGQAGGVVQEPQRLGDRATVGVGVDEQDLTARGGGFEGEVDGDRGAARPALRPPHGGQDPPGVAVGRGRDVRLRGRVLEVGFGEGGVGLVDERLRRVGVGGDVQEPELAEPALAVLVAGRGHPDHREPGGGHSRARASRSSHLVPAATTATSAWPAAATASRSPRS